MSARSRRLNKSLLANWQPPEPQVSEAKVTVLDEGTLEISLPAINPMYVPLPRLYQGQSLSAQEQELFDSLLREAYEGDR